MTVEFVYKGMTVALQVSSAMPQSRLKKAVRFAAPAAVLHYYNADSQRIKMGSSPRRSVGDMFPTEPGRVFISNDDEGSTE